MHNLLLNLSMAFPRKRPTWLGCYMRLELFRMYWVGQTRLTVLDGVIAAMDGSLPLFVLSAIRSMNDSRCCSIWKFILTSAHELAGAKADFYPSTLHGFSSLVINAPWGACIPAPADCMLAGS